ncbi:unnamed protein product [Rotaria sordida]|uniref:Uncharacterized protein n=1 Tax=Rotaria sordida TaxID=392033 RepID=A0A815CXL9_9BILA|nr:unnamed protein product [Rotaria sordida]
MSGTKDWPDLVGKTFDEASETILAYDSKLHPYNARNGVENYMLDLARVSCVTNNNNILGLCLHSTVCDFLVTSSFDESVKVWHIESENITFLTDRQFQTDRTNTCLANFDFPFRFALDGQSKAVRSRFHSRAKFEMIEVANKTALSTASVSSFPTTALTVTSAILKAQRNKLFKKNK